jgi:hypothetical protein
VTIGWRCEIDPHFGGIRSRKSVDRMAGRHPSARTRFGHASRRTYDQEVMIFRVVVQGNCSYVLPIAGSNDAIDIDCVLAVTGEALQCWELSTPRF